RPNTLRSLPIHPPPTTDTYTLSLHDALPISDREQQPEFRADGLAGGGDGGRVGQVGRPLTQQQARDRQHGNGQHQRAAHLLQSREPDLHDSVPASTATSACTATVASGPVARISISSPRSTPSAISATMLRALASRPCAAMRTSAARLLTEPASSAAGRVKMPCSKPTLRRRTVAASPGAAGAGTSAACEATSMRKLPTASSQPELRRTIRKPLSAVTITGVRALLARRARRSRSKLRSGSPALTRAPCRAC